MSVRSFDSTFRGSWRELVYLVFLVYLVCLVSLNKKNKIDYTSEINWLASPASGLSFFSCPGTGKD